MELKFQVSFRPLGYNIITTNVEHVGTC